MSDIELPIRFESAHSVPKLFTFLHFDTSLLIARDRPRAHIRRLDCLNIKSLSQEQTHSLQMVYKRKTTRHMWLPCKCNMVMETDAVRKSHAVAGGPSYRRFLGPVFES